MTLAERMIVMNAGRDGADRHARRGLPPAGDDVRRRLHRLAADEPGARPRRRRRLHRRRATAAAAAPAPRAGELVMGVRPGTRRARERPGGRGLAAARRRRSRCSAPSAWSTACSARRSSPCVSTRRMPLSEDRRDRRAARRRPRTCTGSTRRRRARRACACSGVRRRRDRALALPALDRAPRRRQARAREHAGGVSRRRGARLSRVRMRRQAARRRRARSCSTTRRWSARPRATALRRALPWSELSRLDAGGWHSPALCRRAARRASPPSPRSACATASRSTSRSSLRRAADARDRPRGRRDGGALWAGERRRRCSARFVPTRSRARATPRPICRARCCSTRCAAAGSTRRARSAASRSSLDHATDGCAGARRHPRRWHARRRLYGQRPDRGAPARSRSASTASSPTRSIVSRPAARPRALTRVAPRRSRRPIGSSAPRTRA